MNKSRKSVKLIYNTFPCFQGNLRVSVTRGSSQFLQTLRIQRTDLMDPLESDPGVDPSGLGGGPGSVIHRFLGWILNSPTFGLDPEFTDILGSSSPIPMDPSGLWAGSVRSVRIWLDLRVPDTCNLIAFLQTFWYNLSSWLYNKTDSLLRDTRNISNSIIACSMVSYSRFV